MSRHVVRGFPQQRLAYLSEKIEASQAQYCAVLKMRTFEILGLVRFSQIAANPGTATRILADLMDTTKLPMVLDSDPVERVVDLLVESEPRELAVEQQSGAFVGLITPESFTRWLLASTPSLESALQRLPANSLWNPYPPFLETDRSQSA